MAKYKGTAFKYQTGLQAFNLGGGEPEQNASDVTGLATSQESKIHRKQWRLRRHLLSFSGIPAELNKRSLFR